jgi:hypothetical protein
MPSGAEKFLLAATFEYSRSGKVSAAKVFIRLSFYVDIYFLSNEKHMKFNTIQFESTELHCPVHLSSPLKMLLTNRNKLTGNVARIENMRN